MVTAAKVKKPKAHKLVVKRGGVPPSVFLYSVSDKSWEEFIAVACRNRSPSVPFYHSVKVLGNSGDKGRDVEARLHAVLATDSWDLYQAKHYGFPLAPSNAFPEMTNFFGHLMDNSYPAPRKYYFCAPRNTGPELHDLLASPSKLKSTFLNAWRTGTQGLKGQVNKLTPKMEAFVSAFDFSKFEECLVVQLLDWHANDSIAHCKLFGIEPERGEDPTVPSLAQANEMTYVEQLILAYTEEDSSVSDMTGVQSNEVYREHLAAAREAFYAAEGLKRFSRDIFVEDEFSKLMDMVGKGIRLKVNSPLLKSGLQRHDAAIEAAQQVSVTDSVLHSRLRGGDLPGTCHHLVNEKKLKWVR